METIFMQSKNSKTSEAHRFRFNLTNKPNLKYAKNNVALANLSIYYTWKNINSECNKNEFKKSAPTWSENLIRQMDHIIFQRFKIASNLSSRNMKLQV